MIKYDWGTGIRTVSLPDGRKCVHPKHPDEPINYSGFHEWAAAHGRKHRQLKCATPGCPVLDWADGPRGGVA